MRRFVQVVDRQPSLRVGEGAETVPRTLARLGECGERAGELTAEAVPLGSHPVLEVGRVTDREPLQEVTTEQLHRGLQPAIGDQGTEPVHVDGDAVALDQTHVVAGRFEELAADRTAQRRQGAPQGSARVRRVVPRPEQVGQPVPGAGPVGESQEGEHGERLAGVEGDVHTVAFDPWGAQQADLDHAAHPLS